MPGIVYYEKPYMSQDERDETSGYRSAMDISPYADCAAQAAIYAIFRCY